jgi:hypothetical protein
MLTPKATLVALLKLASIRVAMVVRHSVVVVALVE